MATEVQAISDDADRQQAMARLFFMAGNILSGADAAPRYEPGNVNDSGMMGPGATVPTDIGIGYGGEVYVRGRNGQVATANATPAPPKAAPGIVLSPLTLLLGLGLVLWLSHR